MSLGATREVSSLSRYMLDLEFVLPPAYFASTLRNTQPLWPKTTFLKSPWRSASISAPLAPPSALVASGFTMFSSSPTQPSVSLHRPLNSVLRDPYVNRKLLTRAFQRAQARPEGRARCPATCQTSGLYPLQLVSPPLRAILNLYGHKLHFWNLLVGPLRLGPLSRLYVGSLSRNTPYPPPSPFRLISLSSHLLCSVLAHYLSRLKALNDVFPIHLRPSWTIRVFASNQRICQNQTPELLSLVRHQKPMDLDVHALILNLSTSALI